MSRFRYLLVACCLGLLALPATAAASHNADLHSANVRLDWSFPEAPARTHSDIAMWGSIVVSGNYDGFRILDTSLPLDQRLRVNKLCRGPQNDVALWQYNGRMLLFLANDTPQVNGDTVCSEVRTSDTNITNPLGFEGIRIFDITNPANPQFIRAVRTNCGAHTLTLVPDTGNNRVLIYATTASNGGGPYCVAPHNRIPIVGVPLDAPETASVIAQPSLIPGMRGCHDVTVYLAINLAAASCESEGQLWDITNPAAPSTADPVSRIDAAGVNYWHAAEFTWDGRYVAFNDESFNFSGGCAQPDGRIWIYRVSDQALMSSFMIPRNQGSGYCSAHNGYFIPVQDRYLLVSAWYEGGTSIVDFTNPAAPVEVGFYDASVGRGPADTWSSYWYNNAIYANDIVRGVDVFNIVTPSSTYGLQLGHLNAQTQESEFLPPPPVESMRPVARLVSPPVQRARPGPGGIRPARASRPRATARGRGLLLRSRARASKQR